MATIIGFLTNYFFLSFIIAWVLSVLIKTLLSAISKDKGLDIKDGFRNGGMPSSHSAVVSSITFAVLLTDGLSPTFFVSLALSLIVISDAFMLRYNVGIQAQELNVLLSKAKRKSIPVVKGHTFPQVIGGIFVGILTSYVLFLMMF